MTEDDLKYMNEAVKMAYDCKPIRDDIPKVAAIIVAEDGTVIGRGIRGDGGQDDDHAEHHPSSRDIFGSFDDTGIGRAFHWHFY